MREAIDLALKGLGQTSPNPLVGAVVVKNGRVVGRGFHEKAGRPHAEVVALRAAGKNAKGADLYVTLEPCCTFGRTPPCTELVVKSGIKKVIYGMIDPNPSVYGSGLDFLRKHKIKVEGPVCEEACRNLNRPYIKWITTGMPFIIAKIALTLDGKIADASGDSKWISNDEAREFVHQLRTLVDAVAVGRGTEKKDKPRLNVRLKGYKGKQPERIIIRSEKSSRPDLEKYFHECGRRGITSVLVEGGSEIHTSLFKKDLVDYLVVFVSPKLLGGRAKSWLGDIGVKGIKATKNLKVEDILVLGDNVVIQGSM